MDRSVQKHNKNTFTKVYGLMKNKDDFRDSPALRRLQNVLVHRVNERKRSS